MGGVDRALAGLTQVYDRRCWAGVAEWLALICGAPTSSAMMESGDQEVSDHKTDLTICSKALGLRRFRQRR